MLKTLALENLLTLISPKTKKISKITAKEENGFRFLLGSFLIALNLMLLMNYVYGVNEFASSGYELKTLQKQLSALNTENKRINL